MASAKVRKSKINFRETTVSIGEENENHVLIVALKSYAIQIPVIISVANEGSPILPYFSSKIKLFLDLFFAMLRVKN